MEQVYCPLCGKPNPVDNKFCDFCLAHLEPSEGEPSQTTEGTFPGIEDNHNGLGGHSSESEVPNWLSELNESDSKEAEEPIDPGSGLGKPAESISEWMTGIPEDQSADKSSDDDLFIPEEASPVLPFVSDQDLTGSDEIPGWLNEAITEGDAQDISEPQIWDETTPDKYESDVSQVDSSPAKPTEDESGDLENAGPLAGLKGVLSAEPGITRARKPAVYSTNLRVSTTQRAHIELLQSLLEEEGHPQPLPKRRSISQQHVLRWVIALVLLLTIVWSVVIADQNMPFPIYDEGSAEVNRLIAQLSENASVLIGFDYEPGLAAELDAAAAPVIDHLMSQKALMTLVSTSTSGPILAERTMQSAQTDLENVSGTQYVNLGYIPGDAVGLRSFIENPNGTLPYSIEGLPAWGTDSTSALPPLDGINQITDYSMVILIVDDPDVARTWIEQLGPEIIDPQVLTSFVIIASAQLEPVIRPYFESSPQPVNGMVVGLRGGAAYARISGSEVIPRQYWDAFGMGTFIAAMLILVGGLGYYVIPELSRTVKDQREA